MPDQEPFVQAVTFQVAPGQVVMAGRRVKVNNDGTVQHAGAADLSPGVANNTISADNTDGINPVQPRGRDISITNFETRGAISAVAAGAIAVGAEVQGAADGKVQAGAGLKLINITPDVTADGQTVMLVPVR